jgi:hypothetical protein
LTPKKYFFGFESGDLVNLILIIAKNYIFKCKLNEQRLNIVEFKHKIMWYRSLEQYISKKNNTILAFDCLFVSYIDEILFSVFLITYKMSGAI